MRFDGLKTKQKFEGLTITKLSSVKNPAHRPAVASIIKSSQKEYDEELKKKMLQKMIDDNKLAKKETEFLTEIFQKVYGDKKMPTKDPKKDPKDEKIEMTPEEKKAMLEQARKDAITALTKAVGELDVDAFSFYKTLAADEQTAFLAKSVTERAVDIKLAKSSEEILLVDGITIRKSEAGEGVFALLKKQQEKLDAGDVRFQKSQDELQQKEFIQKAEELFPNLPGTPEEKGDFYKTLQAMPKEQQESTITMLKASDDAMGVDYEEIGTSLKKNTDVAKAADDKLMSIAKGIQKEKPGITFEKAYTMAMDTEEGAAAYEAMR